MGWSSVSVGSNPALHVGVPVIRGGELIQFCTIWVNFLFGRALFMETIFRVFFSRTRKIWYLFVQIVIFVSLSIIEVSFHKEFILN